jgi:hypothetical protein
MTVPLKDGVTRACGGVAPLFKCDQTATFWSTSKGAPPRESAANYPGWCCPLGHFEAQKPQG